MSLAENLLDHSYIKRYRISHQGVEKQIKQAAQYMEDEHWNEEEALLALKKILPALTEKVLRVFFSYKSKDEDTAKKIVGILRLYSAEKIKITYMADFPKEIVGKPWRDEIRKGVEEANWFILLLPDPREDWDWCLYETGLFERELTKADKLLCIHHPEVEMPRAIKDYQGIKAHSSSMEQFLQMIFVNGNPLPGMDPINRAIESDIPAIATRIVNAIRPPSKEPYRRRFHPWVKLRIEHAAKLKNQDELDSAIVEKINIKALKLFGKLDQPPTWGELRSDIEEYEGDSRWRKELMCEILDIANNRENNSIHAVFKSYDGRTFRPFLFAIDRDGKNGSIIAYHVNFIEDVSAIDTKAFPRKIATIVTLLRMAIRFRWEILEPFTEHELIGRDFENLSNVIKQIEQDSESRGLLNKFSILKLFTEENLVRIQEMFDSWEELHVREDLSGILDIAIRERDSQKIYELLTHMIPTNQEFLRMGADRFLELVSNQE